MRIPAFVRRNGQNPYSDPDAAEKTGHDVILTKNSILFPELFVTLSVYIADLLC